MALSVGEIKQGLVTVGLEPRWCPHNEMLADCLTKRTSQCNFQPILRLLRTGRYRLQAEGDEEEYRKALKEAGQTISRLKGKADKKVESE